MRKYSGINRRISEILHAASSLSGDDPLALVCLNCLKNLIVTKEHPREVKYIMESMLRCMRTGVSKTISPGQRKIAICLSKKFIQNVMFVEIEDKNKMQYFLDALFALIGASDFAYFEVSKG